MGEDGARGRVFMPLAFLSPEEPLKKGKDHEQS